jgi:hypothetical protein
MIAISEEENTAERNNRRITISKGSMKEFYK